MFSNFYRKERNVSVPLQTAKLALLCLPPSDIPSMSLIVSREKSSSNSHPSNSSSWLARYRSNIFPSDLLKTVIISHCILGSSALEKKPWFIQFRAGTVRYASTDFYHRSALLMEFEAM